MDVERAFFAAGGRELPRPEYRVAPEVRRRRDAVARAAGAADRATTRSSASCATPATRWPPRPACWLAVGTQGLLLPLGRAVRPAGQPAVRSPHHQPGAGPSTSTQVVDGVRRRRPTRPLDELVYTAEEAVPLLKARFDALLSRAATSGSRWSTTSPPKAAASADGIKHQARGAVLARATCAQIEFHEGHVHVATALNGRAQPVMVVPGRTHRRAPPAPRRGWRC